MKAYKIFTVIITIIFICVYLYLFSGDKKTNSFNDSYSSLLPQVDSYDRNLVEKKALKSKKFTDNDIVIIPGMTRMFDETILISDFSDFSFYHHSYDGKWIGSIKPGKGSGPGEIRHLMDFDVINHTLWVVDSELFRVSSFDLNTGEFINSFSVEKRPSRIITLKTGLIIQWFGSEKLFSKFDFEGNELAYFGTLTDDQLQNPLSFDGHLASNRNDRFVYVPAYASLIYVYDENCQLLHTINTPDDLSFPRTLQSGNISRAPNIGDNYTMVDSFISDHTLSVYTARFNLENSRDHISNMPFALIDLYDLESGTYLRSIELPFFHEKGMPFLHLTGKYDTNHQLFFSTTAYEGDTIKTIF